LSSSFFLRHNDFMSSRKDSSPSGDHFRPSKLECPRIGIAQSDYRNYVRDYMFYLKALDALKNEFWSESKVRYELQEKVVWRLINTSSGKAIGDLDEKPETTKEGQSAYRTVVAVAVPLKAPEPVEKPAPEPPKAKTAEQVAEAKARKLGKERRRKERKRILDAKTSLGYASDLKKLADINSDLSKSKFSFGVVGVSTHAVPIQGKKKKKAAKKPKTQIADSAAPPTEPTDGPPPGPSPDNFPSAPASPKEGDSREESKGKKPSRRERRRAIYGPLTTSEGVEEAPAVSAPGPAGFSFGFSSDEEEVAKSPPKPAPFSFEGDSSDEEPLVPRVFPLTSFEKFAGLDDYDKSQQLTLSENSAAVRAAIHARGGPSTEKFGSDLPGVVDAERRVEEAKASSSVIPVVRKPTAKPVTKRGGRR